MDTSTVLESIDLESIPSEVVARFAALADPTRLAILQVLSGEPRCVCDVNEAVPVAANVLSYHLKVLREAGLVTATRRGRWVDYALDAAALAATATPCPARPRSGSADGHLPGPASAGTHARAAPRRIAGWGSPPRPRLVGPVRGQRPRVGHGRVRLGRVGRGVPVGRGGPLLLLRHRQDRAAADRDHVRDRGGTHVHHPGAHPGAAGGPPRGRRQRRRGRSGGRDAVLLVLGGAGVHRVRVRRDPVWG